MVLRSDSTIRARPAFSCARDACADKPCPVNVLGPSKPSPVRIICPLISRSAEMQRQAAFDLWMCQHHVS